MKKIEIPQGRLHELLRREGCEVVLSTPQLIVARIPGWDAAFAHTLQRWPWLSVLWDRIEITRTGDGASEQHQVRLTYFTSVNLAIHCLLCALTLIAAASNRPPNPTQLLLFLLVISLLVPAAAYHQTRMFCQKIHRWNIACNLRRNDQRRHS